MQELAARKFHRFSFSQDIVASGVTSLDGANALYSSSLIFGCASR
jgi:hypothetical protein